MNPERWQRVKQVCDVLLECEQRDRPNLLTELCAGDEELKREVETLLAQPMSSEGILDAPVWKKVGLEAGSSERWMPKAIGRYRVIRLVGEGGMGAVYEAEQDHPRRTVALKVIKPGLTNTELLRRFERESQALGRLQHPGIAQIYEAGTADSGFGPQPYFAMEFIHGKALNQYVTTSQLPTRTRLDLVARICDAVEHAHQRGLIHRDLKPGNILVDASDQPKILDFGVARLVDADAQASLQTDLGQLVGTLAYMSPEQVSADPLELDTRSDVYALGVILYELLAGRLPYKIGNKVHESVQVIREQDPEPLSSVSRTYRGDVETIVTKALEKDKSRRYASASALAQDIRRFMADEPITARPASASYQLHKFARRHKALVGGVVSVFVVLLAGVVVSTWQAVRAGRAERAAVAAEDRAAQERDAATKERNIAVSAQQQAQEERNQAVAAKQRADTEAAISREVNTFLQKDLLSQSSVRAQSQASVKPDPDLKVRTVLDRAATNLQGKFRDQPLVEASIRETIGQAYDDLGLSSQARQHWERAFELRKKEQGANDRQTLDVLVSRAHNATSEGKYPLAEELFSKAIDGLQRTLGTEHPDVIAAKNQFESLYLYEGKYQQAEGLLRNILPVGRRVLGADHPDMVVAGGDLALAYMYQGKYPEAERQYRDSLAQHMRVFGLEHPDTLLTMNGLALTIRSLGKRVEAQSLYGTALETQRRILGVEHPDTLNTMNNLALLYVGEGKYKEAEPLYVEVLKTRARLLGEAHPDTLFSMNNLGSLYSDEGRFVDAQPLLEKAVELRRRVLGADHPNTFNAMTNVAQMNYRLGKFKEPESAFTEILAGRRRVLGPDHSSTLLTLNHLAVTYSREGRLKEAESLLVPLLESWRKVFGEDHAETVRTMHNLGTVYLQKGDLAEAQNFLTKALAGRQHLFGDRHPDTLQTACTLAALYDKAGKTEEAKSLLQTTLKTQREILGDEHFETLRTIETLADIYRRRGESEQAKLLFSQALAVRRRVFGAQNPDTIEDLSKLGLISLQQQKYTDVEYLLGDAVKLDGDNGTWYSYYSKSILGAALTAEKRFAEAEKSLIDGYIATAEPATLVSADRKAAVNQAGQWILQLYQSWGKPERVAEWTQKLSISAANAPIH